MVKTTFESFNLHHKLMKNLQASGYKQPTPVQAKAIPEVLEGRDVTALAQTGTGKTAAFILPILHHLLTVKGQGHNIRALVLAPTRELAEQITEVTRMLAADTGIKCLPVFGGVSVQAQVRKLNGHIDIVVACPGRLLDLMGRKAIRLTDVETLVLDEADQMLDLGFFPDIRRIVKALPVQRQTLMFSATMPREIESLSLQMQNEPQRIEIARSQVASKVNHSLFRVEQQRKTDLLYDLLGTKEHSTLVFTRTKHRARQLAVKLQKAGHKSASLHGNLSVNQRRSAVDGFKAGRYRILVATDIAARGLDIDGIEQVINFDFPSTPESYVHRIGRTGRAGQSGVAYTFAMPEDDKQVRRLEKQLKGRLTVNSHRFG